MKIINSFTRILKYTNQHITRNFWHSVLFVLVLLLTMVVSQFFVLGSFVSDQVLTYLENQPQVLVFFKDNVQGDQLLQIKSELEKDELIESVTYVSKEQALEIYRDLHQDEQELLEFVTADILPASLEISGNDVKYLSQVALQFRENQFVEQVVFQQDLVQEVLRLTDAVRLVGFSVLGVLGVIALILIIMVVTQNLSLFSREIEIMRLVGASASSIAMPFIFDGILFSFASVVISSFGLHFAIGPIKEFVNSFIAPIGTLNAPEWFLVIPSMEDLLSKVGLQGLDVLAFNFGLWTLLASMVLTSTISLFVVVRKMR